MGSPSLRGSGDAPGVGTVWALGGEGPDDVMPLMVMKALLVRRCRVLVPSEGGVSSRPPATAVATDAQRPGSQQLASW